MTLNKKTVKFLNNRVYYNGSEPLMRESDKAIVTLLKDKKGTLLDFSSGTGRFYDLLKRANCKLEYTGYEPESDMVDMATENFAPVFTDNIEELEDSYDYVIAIDLLREYADPLEAREVIDTLMKVGKNVIFHVWANEQDVINKNKMNGDVLIEKHYSQKTLDFLFSGYEVETELFEIKPFHCKVIKKLEPVAEETKPIPKKTVKKKASKKASK